MTNNNNPENNCISDTVLGRSWLSQFHQSDQDTAKLLLDSILYVSNQQFVSGLNDLILGFVDHHTAGPIALFAVRENTGELYWRRPDSRPLSVGGRRPVGSEGIIANLCRDVARSTDRVLDHPSIQEIRNARCRSILCVDDMIGSGSRMTSFAEWLYMNRTIRSWHSLHYIEFFAIAYTASDIGRTYVENSRIYSNVEIAQSIGIGRSIWTGGQRLAVSELCEKYAEYTGKPDWPIGFRDAFTTIAFAHKCPNTNPAILWASKTNSWRGLFPIRPEFVISGLGGARKWQQQERILKALGHTRLLQRILKALGHTRLLRPSHFSKLSAESRQLLVFLSCLAARRRRDTILSDILELSLPEVRRQIARCQLYRWIDGAKRLTQLGKNVLEAARRNECIPNEDIVCKNDFYYPKTFRSPASPSS